MERPGQRQGDECGEGRADQHRRHKVDILPLGVRMLDHGPLRRAGQRHAQRHQRADERPATTAQQLRAVHPADAQPGEHDGRPGARGKLVPDERRAASAVNSGPSDIVTSTLAVEVRVSATMKAVNITAQQTPEIQSERLPRRSSENTARPRQSGKITSSASIVKRLRQKVISKLCACARCRVTTPAVPHMRVTATINRRLRHA